MNKNFYFEKEDLTKMAGLYKLFGEPTRLKIISILINKEACVYDLVNILEISQSLISHQLRKLKDGNIVKFRKEGKKSYYSMVDNHVKNIFEIGLNHVKDC